MAFLRTELAGSDMRYALYFAAPADDPLMKLGASWLGRDPFTGAPVPQPGIDGLTASRLAALTDSPRRYGFHGTLKAPFHLRDGKSEADLITACRAFAAETAPFRIDGLSVNRLGKFVALTPDQPEPELAAFAALCVKAFEAFRAPLDAADLERRRKSGLSQMQDTYLTDWGYPYIFDEFRFHMTLSNKLDDPAEAEAFAAAARPYFAAVTGTPRACTTFALYREPERGAPFTLHTLFELTGATPAADAQAAHLTRKEIP